MPDPADNSSADAESSASQTDADVSDQNDAGEGGDQDAGEGNSSPASAANGGQQSDAEVRALLLKAERGELDDEGEDATDESEDQAEDDADASDEAGESDDANGESDEDENAEDDDAAEGSEESEDAAGSKATKTPKRIGIAKFGPKSRALLSAAEQYVREHPGTELFDAFKALGITIPGEQAKTAEADATANETANKDKGPSELEKLETDIKAKRKELRAARQGFDDAKEEQLEDEIAALMRKQVTLEFEQRQAATATKSKLESEVDKTFETVAKAIPEFNDEASELSKASDRLAKSLGPAFFQDAKWPARLAAMAWQEVNPDKPMPTLAPKVAVVAKVKAPVPPVAKPKRKGVPAASLTSSRGGSDQDDINQALNSDDPAVVRKALAKLGA